MYQFSLKAYSVVFKDALAKAEPAPELDARVLNLLDSITFCVYVYTCRGLFERDKIVFLFLVTLQVTIIKRVLDIEQRTEIKNLINLNRN